MDTDNGTGARICLLYPRFCFLSTAFKKARAAKKRDPQRQLSPQERTIIESVCAAYLEAVMRDPPAVPSRTFAAQFRE